MDHHHLWIEELMMQQHDSLSVKLRSDLSANRGDPKGTIVVVGYRLANAARGTGTKPRAASIPVGILYQIIIGWILGVEIPWSACIGQGLKVQHGYGIVVHRRSTIGSFCTLKQGVTLGVRGGSIIEDGAPVLGDNVIVGSHAQILGPVRIGSGAKIGAAAVVLSDVPAESSAVGNPARIILKEER